MFAVSFASLHTSSTPPRKGLYKGKRNQLKTAGHIELMVMGHAHVFKQRSDHDFEWPSPVPQSRCLVASSSRTR